MVIQMKNKNKQKIGLLLTFLFLLSIASVTAIQFPMVTYGLVEFDGVTYANQKVTAYNARLNSEWVTYTNGQGQYQFIWNNLKDSTLNGLIAGDKVDIVACPVEINADCKKTVTVSTIPGDLSWGIDDGNAADLVSDDAVDADTVSDDDTTTSTDDGDSSASAECGDLNCGTLNCPSCQPATPVCLECAVCPELDDEEEDSYLVEAIAGVLLFLAGGAGVYYFKRKDAVLPNGTFVKFGGSGPKHFHRGIKGYHKPDTLHREKHERHPEGELDPKYEKDEDGRYVYVD